MKISFYNLLNMGPFTLGFFGLAYTLWSCLIIFTTGKSYIFGRSRGQYPERSIYYAIEHSYFILSFVLTFYFIKGLIYSETKYIKPWLLSKYLETIGVLLGVISVYNDYMLEEYFCGLFPIGIITFVFGMCLIANTKYIVRKLLKQKTEEK